MFVPYESLEFKDWTSELHEYRAAASNSYATSKDIQSTQTQLQWARFEDRFLLFIMHK